MEIHSATFNQYTAQSNAIQSAQSPHAQQAVKQTQQQNNESVSSTEKTSDSDNANQNTSQSANTNKTDKPLADGKAVKQAEVEQALSEKELKQVSELKRRDTEVRAHEAAHLAAAGKYATGGASFDYKRGPDGKSYAVGGEVGIDTSPVPNDPQATLRKAQQIQAAAHAPANPSAQDRQVAASASAMAANARAEISQETIEGQSSGGSSVVKNEKTAGSRETNTEAGTKAESNATGQTENQKASHEYKAVAGLIEDNITPLLQQIA